MTARTSRSTLAVKAVCIAVVAVAATGLATAPRSADTARTASAATSASLPTTAEIPSEFRAYVTWIADDVSRYWEGVYGAGGSAEFTRPELVFFTDVVTSPCDDGVSTAEEGPFYCSNAVYIPDAWFAAADLRMHDMAIAYVLAHEIAHDVQDTQGILSALTAGTITSVATELQADCLAGVWAADADRRGMLEAGDYEEAVNLALTIGDDYLGFPPEEYSHGTSAERIAWFDYGFATADGAACRTY